MNKMVRARSSSLPYLVGSVNGGCFSEISVVDFASCRQHSDHSYAAFNLFGNKVIRSRVLIAKTEVQVDGFSKNYYLSFIPTFSFTFHSAIVNILALACFF